MSKLSASAFSVLLIVKNKVTNSAIKITNPTATNTLWSVLIRQSIITIDAKMKIMLTLSHSLPQYS